MAGEVVVEGKLRVNGSSKKYFTGSTNYLKSKIEFTYKNYTVKFVKKFSIA